ncbi:MAG TPA: hypothetical protein VN622_13040 [Clostridia bacterium]|nr:hypothetical protein [Clostridia bacterium]
MGYLLEFDSSNKILRVTVDGELTDQGASDLYNSVREFLASEKVCGGILDLSPVTVLAVSSETVRRMAKNPRLFQGAQIRVIVAPRDLDYGLARMFQISRSEVHNGLHVVHTLNEAYKIHGLRSPSFTSVTRSERKNVA